MNFLARFVEKAASEGVIKSSDKELQYYALPNLLFTILTWTTLFVAGFLTLKHHYYCLLFMLVYIPARIFAGGLHFGSRLRCYISSLVIFALLLLGGSYSTAFSGNALSIGAIASSILIYIFAPVEDKNRPLDEKQVIVYRKIARSIAFSELCLIYLIYILLNNNLILYYLVASQSLLALQLVLGRIKNSLS